MGEMKRNRWGGAIVALAVTVCMLVPVSGMSAAEDDDGPQTRSWAVYLYCGADNDYEDATDFALEQCVKALAEEGADTESVYVVALLDRRSSEGTWVYELTAGGLGSPVSGWAGNERDTTDPATMEDFLDFVAEAYPADNTLLVVKNGHAWCGVCPDWTEQDETYLMPIDGLASALAGRGIDVLALDGDNMASIEVAYELRHSTDYFVGTQQDIPLDGLPYYLLLKDMTDGEWDGGMSQAEEVARSIVDNYVLYYNNTDGKKNLNDHLLSNSQMAVTAAAFRMGEGGERIAAVVDAFDAYLDYMMYGELPEAIVTEAEALGIDVDEKLDQWMAPDPSTGEDVWSWVPLNRNNIASSRDKALIGKMSDQAGYEWLPDVYTWLWSMPGLVNYEDYGDPEPPSGDTSERPLLEELKDPFVRMLLEDFMEAFGYEEEGIYRGVWDAEYLTGEGALVWVAQSQILDRSGNSFPHGLNIWFPPSPTQWESLDYTRERTYLYDGSLVELPAEYYCVDCPFDYGSIDLDFVEDTPWMDFFELYYDSRWVAYGNPDAPKETPLWNL